MALTLLRAISSKIRQVREANNILNNFNNILNKKLDEKKVPLNHINHICHVQTKPKLTLTLAYLQIDNEKSSPADFTIYVRGLPRHVPSSVIIEHFSTRYDLSKVRPERERDGTICH